MVPALFRGAGRECEACVVDISSRGLAASVAEPPSRGEYVELLIGKNSLVGQVRWSGPRRFGIAFRDRISVTAALSGELGGISARERQAVRARAERKASGGSTLGRRIEFAIFAAAGAIATLYIADFAGSALGAFESVNLALGGRPAQASVLEQ